MTTTTSQGNSPTDRQRKQADERAQRAACLLNDLCGTEHLLDDARLAILAMNLRAALARLEKVKEGWQ